MRAQMSYKALSGVHEFFRSESKKAGIVGGTIAIINDEVPAMVFHGFADAEKKIPVVSETIFHWASNTKPFTGIAIMQLRDRGLLKLDDPVTKYLPELRSVHNSFGSMDEITIRHLMTHSAGFRGGTWPWGDGKDWEPFEPQEYSQLVAMFPYTEIRFKPGSKFSYSNPGVVFLGRIIETITKEDYEVYVDKNILKPLRMYSSYFDTTPPYLLKHRSHSYYIDAAGKRTEGRFDANTGVTVSNSGLNAPVSDMVRYVNFLTGRDTNRDPRSFVNGPVFHEEILKRSSLEEMFRPQLPAALDANGNEGFTTDVGLIFFIDSTLSKTHLGHGGDQNGFISYIDFDPAKRKGSIVVFNTNVLRPENATDADIYTKLRRAVRSLY
jgi:CubicO group peptidase (beta-lactamase class C family)